MTEELSQDSSRPQETSQDSGVSSEGQLSNPTGENTAAQNSQKSQVVTKHNNQNNKKYDLGVLFVHGIGFQNRGDTFKAIYPSIKNEFESNGAYKYKEVVLSNNGAPEIEAKITCDGQVKDVFFCESNWHGSSATHGSDSVCKILKRWASNLQAILWLIYFIGLRISHARIFGFLFSISLVFLYMLLRSKWQEVQPEFYDMTNRGIDIRSSLLWSAIILMSPFIILQFAWEYFAGKTRNMSRKQYFLENVKNITLYGIFKKLFYVFSCLLMIFIFIVTPKTFEIFIVCSVFVGLSCLVFSIFSSAGIAELWNQITESADFVRTGDDFQYIQSLERDIDKLDGRCNKIIVIAHSMGEYLSYNSIRRSMKNFKGKEVQLISFGGGLGLVSLIGDLRLSNKKNELSHWGSAFLSLGAATQAFILAAGNIFAWCGLALDIYRAVPVFTGNISWISFPERKFTNPNFPFETENWNFNIWLHFGLLAFFNITGMYIEKTNGIKMIGSSNFKFFRYSHLLDPVGNSVGFYYGRGVEQTITPHGGLGHAIRTYYTGKNIKSAKVVYDKDIYIPKRTVQHIVSTAYGKPSLLPQKTKPAWNALVGVISWVASSYVLTWVMRIDPSSVIVLLPIFAGFSYIVLSAMLWMWVVADVLRDSSRSISDMNTLKRILWGIFWMFICTFVNVGVDFNIILAIDAILNI